MALRSADDRRSLRWAWLVIGLWLIACLGLLIDFATDYRSLIGWLGEWQFEWFDCYFPSVTITLALLIAVLPLIAVAAIFAQRRRRRRESAAALRSYDEPLARATASALRGNRLFGMLSILLAFSAFGALIIASKAPTAEGPVRSLDLARPVGVVTGHARFDRPTRVGRIARVYENVAFASRTMWVAPVYGGRNAGGVAYWTEVLPTDIRNRFRRLGTGVFVPGGLPPEVAPLYHYIDIPVAAESGLLMVDSDRPRWRMRALAVQGAVVSLLALLIALVLRRQVKRLRTRAERQAAAAS